MSKILDLQKRANDLLSQHQNDIDEKLSSEISQIFRDMQNTVRSEARSLNSSIDKTKNGYTAETERSNERDIAADQTDYSPNETAAATRHDSPTARTTTADQTATSELATIERLEPRNSPSSEVKENPYFIEYSLDFTGMYNAYQQYLSGIRQQEQIQRYTSDAEKVDYLKSQGGSMITTTCGKKLCVELDPNHLQDNYSLDNGMRPLA